MPARRLAADWVVPVISPPIRHGAVLLGDDGRIVAVGPESTVPEPPGVAAESFPGAVLLPGLVNAHTHLELTGLGAALDEPDFPSWIRTLQARKAERTPQEFREAARRGVRDCWVAGVTTVADTGDTGAAAHALAELGGRGVVYQEVFGPHPDQCDESMRGLREAIAALRPLASGQVRLGVSPHAPYTVSGRLCRAAARWAREEGLPLALHLAESADESALLQGGSGGFGEAWARRGIPAPAPLGLSPVVWVDRHMMLGPDTLCIHAVRVSDADVAMMAERRVTVAHCPLSNRAHGHGAAPLAALLQAGIEVGVGTDSVLSVGTLDLLAEARAARALAGLSAAEALRLITIDGAVAIGFDGQAGALAPGRLGDVVVLAATGHPDDPVEAALSGIGEVVATFVAGRDVYRRGHG